MAHGITGRLVTAGTSHGGLALSGCGEEAFLVESSIAKPWHTLAGRREVCERQRISNMPDEIDPGEMRLT